MKTCREFRRALRSAGAMPPEGEAHLFSCPRCRRATREERVEREIEGLRFLASPEAAVPPDFVGRVMRRLPGVPAARAAVPRWAWAAALAIFSAAAGYGYTIWAESAAAGQQVSASPAPVEDLAVLSF